MKTKHLTLHMAIRQGVLARIRPVVMTALMGSIGLLPAALSTGTGSETSRPLATVVCAGLITDIMFDLLALPVLFYYAYRKQHLTMHADDGEAPQGGAGDEPETDNAFSVV
jgi:cobalt-zinc-cadmium resistance protein CzcA